MGVVFGRQGDYENAQAQFQPASWVRQVVGMLESQLLGRFGFCMLLAYIRSKTAADPAGPKDELRSLSDEIEGWVAGSAEQRVERLFLLKELRIGCREQELPTWSGHVTKAHSGKHEAHGELFPSQTSKLEEKGASE